MTEIEVHQGGTLALDHGQQFWSEHQIAALRQIGVDRATNGDLAVFHHVCQRTGLDPFARQIYMIERQGKQTIQTGIDGFRLVARRAVDRSGESLSIGAPEWCDQDGAWHDVWLSPEPPAAARMTVRRGGDEYPAVALWREYAQTKRDGNLTAMWASRPAGQLAKCAEALALRKAFPQDLSGIYADEEMARAERAHVVQQRTSGLAAALHTSPVPDVPASVEPPAPPAEPTVDEGDINGQASTGELISDKTRRALFALMGEVGISADDDQRAFLTDTLGRAVESRSTLTEEEGRAAGKRLRRIQEGDADAEWAPTFDAKEVQ